jgi:hypothetical protein
METSAAALIAQIGEGPLVEVEFHVEATMAVPPWQMGSGPLQTGEAYRHDEEQRYEQLFRATGTLRVGDENHRFNGCGLRIRRQGIRRIDTEFRGHCWQSGLFPSGKAFGCMKCPDRPDGAPGFNDGYLFNGDGSLIPARVVQAPWLRKLEPKGQDVSVVLESELGTTTIEGEVALSAFTVPGRNLRPHLPDFPVLQGASVRYRWDGEETYGMMERSSLRNLIEWP